jgi:hypothetical protein
VSTCTGAAAASPPRRPGAPWMVGDCNPRECARGPDPPTATPCSYLARHGVRRMEHSLRGGGGRAGSGAQHCRFCTRAISRAFGAAMLRAAAAMRRRSSVRMKWRESSARRWAALDTAPTSPPTQGARWSRCECVVLCCCWCVRVCVCACLHLRTQLSWLWS